MNIPGEERSGLPECIGGGRKIFLWSVAGEKSRLYLLGSIHVLRPDTYPLDERIDRAYEASRLEERRCGCTGGHREHQPRRAPSDQKSPLHRQEPPLVALSGKAPGKRGGTVW
ncbi:MAG: TraB/GumN family protein [Desulfomonilia bacterium]